MGAGGAQGKQWEKSSVSMETVCDDDNRSLLPLASRPVSTENLLDVVAMVVVHFRLGQAAVPVRFVRLEVLNVGKAVVQLRVVVIGFVVLFLLVAVVVAIGIITIIGVVMVLVEFVLGHGLDGRWFQRGCGSNRSR